MSAVRPVRRHGVAPAKRRNFRPLARGRLVPLSRVEQKRYPRAAGYAPVLWVRMPVNLAPLKDAVPWHPSFLRYCRPPASLPTGWTTACFPRVFGVTGMNSQMKAFALSGAGFEPATLALNVRCSTFELSILTPDFVRFHVRYTPHRQTGCMRGAAGPAGISCKTALP